MINFFRSIFKSNADETQESTITREKFNKIIYHGNKLLAEKDFQGAIDVYKKALNIYPEDAIAYTNLGCAYKEIGAFEDAKIFLKEAIAINENIWETYYNLAHVEDALVNEKEAIKNCEIASELLSNDEMNKKNYLETSSYLVTMYLKAQQLDKALNRLNLILIIDDSDFKNHCNMVIAFLEKNDNKQAIEKIKIIENIVGKTSKDYANLAIVYSLQKNIIEGKKSFEKALEIDPNDTEISMQYSQLLLLNQEYEKGWKHYEKGLLSIKGSAQIMVDSNFFRQEFTEKKYWKGESLDNKILLLWTEQGTGDSLMMLRYIDKIKKEKNIKLKVICEDSIKEIVKDLPGVNEVIIKPINIFNNLEFDYHCSLMSLPGIFKTTIETIPSDFPYIFIEKEKQDIWQERLKEYKGLKIGLAWAGNKYLMSNNARSIPIKILEPLIKIEGINWFSLQKGESAQELLLLDWPITDWSNDFHTMSDTGALIKNLDLVISVDTSIIHLTGALAQHGWLLNRFASDWRWLNLGQVSPWYPTIKIFRQNKYHDWETVISLIVLELKKLID
ncbi:MAG: tetratricopeptide repeat protein [Pseudomonadota bacterium]